MDAKVLYALAADKSLTGADLRVALLLADRYCRPGDLVDTSVNRSKSAVSHALRHLQDGGWVIALQDVDGSRFYSLIRKPESRRPQRQRKSKKTEGIPGQMSIADYVGADACDADADCIEEVPAGVDISGGRFV